MDKGERINIGLTKIRIGLGWSPNMGPGLNFDLDACAFMLNSEALLPGKGFFVYYGNTSSPENAVLHSGDDPFGRSEQSDDNETIVVDLDKVDSKIQEILIVVTIHEAGNRKLNFGQVSNSYIRIIDTFNNEEVVKYELQEDFSVETGVEFGKLYKEYGKWNFQALGIGYNQDLSFFLRRFFKGQIKK